MNRQPGQEIGRAVVTEVETDGELTLVRLSPELPGEPIAPNSPAAFVIAASMTPKKRTPEEQAQYRPKLPKIPNQESRNKSDNL